MMDKVVFQNDSLSSLVKACGIEPLGALRSAKQQVAGSVERCYLSAAKPASTRSR